MNDTLYVYRINTGSCNGCDVEILASVLLPKFGFDALGCVYTNDPTLANILLVTGAITARSTPYLQAALKQLPSKKIVVALGICPISGGVFRDSYAITGPLDTFVDVDINISGCPPSPKEIAQGLAQACELWRERYHAH